MTTYPHEANLRRIALEKACEITPHVHGVNYPENVVAAAELFFQFLQGAKVTTEALLDGTPEET